MPETNQVALFAVEASKLIERISKEENNFLRQHEQFNNVLEFVTKLKETQSLRKKQIDKLKKKYANVHVEIGKSIPVVIFKSKVVRFLKKEGGVVKKSIKKAISKVGKKVVQTLTEQLTQDLPSDVYSELM